jgi:hypothetical protein
MVDGEDGAPRCQYANCREVATARLVIVLGPTLATRRLCDVHHSRAKEIAQQLAAQAYQLVPLGRGPRVNGELDESAE